MMKEKTKQKIKKIAIEVCIWIVCFVIVFGVFKIATSAAETPETVSNCNHNWSSNYVCEYCGYTCIHGQVDEQGACTVCGMRCADGIHSFYKNGNPDGFCSDCGYACKHSDTTDSVEIVDSNYHNVYKHCNICGIDIVSKNPHTAAPGACYCNSCKITYHQFSEGVCTVCGILCVDGTHSFYKNGSPDGFCSDCGYECKHSDKTLLSYVYVDVMIHKGIYHCNLCGLDDVVVESFHNGVGCICHQCGVHHSYVNGTCQFCGDICSHDYKKVFYKVDAKKHNYNNVCTVCGISKESNSVDVSHRFTSLGSCVDCFYQCPHTYSNADCIICGAHCEHKYQNGTCTICGWACGECHDFSDGSGICKNCLYPCQHTTGTVVRSVIIDEKHHLFERFCNHCFKVVNTFGPVEHDFKYDLSDNEKACACSDCGYENKHLPQNEKVIARLPYDAYKHKTVFSYGCCEYTYYSLIEHSFTSSSGFTCSVCGDYSIVAENYYNIGYNQGLADGADMDSGSVAEGMIFGIYDGMTNVFFSMLDYKIPILEINIANLIISLAAIAIVVFVVKKVI